MPQATNLTVKKDDGTTDVTYTVLTGSGGDKSPAYFRNETASVQPNARPVFKMEAAFNAQKTARRVIDRLEYPYSVTDSSGRVSVVNRVLVETTIVAPVDVPDLVANEAISQHTNLLNHPVVLGSNKAGFAPT